MMEFEWDEGKSERNRLERDLPFRLAIDLFDGQTVEQPDSRQNYGERRMQAVGVVGKLMLFCVYTDRGQTRRIISLRRANRRERDGYRTSCPG